MNEAIKHERSINYTNVIWLVFVHILAMGAFFTFSWTNLIVCFIGVFLLAPLGINIGYHRLLCHRGFNSARWFRNSLVVLGALLGAGAPIHWVAMHRVHHRFSDTEKDPHNSRRGFWYSHVLHLFMTDAHEEDANHFITYAPDLMADPFLVWFNKYWLWIASTTIPLAYCIGGWGLLCWGIFLRQILSWNIMWFVNSASHLWGYRNYDSDDHTVNCWWVALLGAGEGWHNNHHADPSCAAHGHKWWEFDFSFQLIRVLEAVGLVWDVKRPKKIS